MTGTGTQTDPYLIKDVYDFCEIGDTEKYPALLDTDNTYKIYFKMTNHIDFGEHEDYKTGFANTVGLINRRDSSSPTGNCYIDANGYGIRNLIYRTTKELSNSLIKVKEIQNANIANLTFIGTYGFQSYAVISATFRNCNFGAFFSNSEFSKLIGGGIDVGKYIVCYDCTFKLQGVVQEGLEFGYSDFYRCHIDIDLKSVNTPDKLIGGYNSSYRCGLNDIYITGFFRCSDTGIPTYLSQNCLWSNSYIALEFDCPNWEGNFYLNNSAKYSGVSFIDYELANKFISTEAQSSDSFYYLTTDQAQNVEYLQSIGLPITAKGD